MRLQSVPAHSGASGKEVADEYAKAAATGDAPGEEFPEGYRDGISLSHTTRTATEARSQEDVERDRGGVRVGTPTHSLGQASEGSVATKAVLEFLRTIRVGCIGVGRVPPEEEEGDDSKGEGGRPAPP